MPPEVLLREAMPPVVARELATTAVERDERGNDAEELEVLAREEFELKTLPASELLPPSSFCTSVMVLMTFPPIPPPPPLSGGAAAAEFRLPSELKELRGRALFEPPNMVVSLLLLHTTPSHTLQQQQTLAV
jgi:hypothetical protein